MFGFEESTSTVLLNLRLFVLKVFVEVYLVHKSPVMSVEKNSGLSAAVSCNKLFNGVRSYENTLFVFKCLTQAVLVRPLQKLEQIYFSW